MIASLASFARDFQYLGINYTVIDEVDCVCMTKAGFGGRQPVNDVSGDITIPYEVFDGGNRYIVKEIGSYSFDKNNKITSISIPASVTTIGEGAFRCCRSLTSVILPNSIKTIPKRAFYYCSALSSIEFSASLNFIGEAAFEGTNLSTISLPNSLETIEKLAFYNSSLTSVYIPENVKSVGAGAFSCEIFVAINNPLFMSLYGVLYNKDKSQLVLYPAGLEFNPDVLNNVTGIGDGAFYGCKMTSIEIPATIKTMGEWIFENCTSLESAVLSPSINYIPTGTFSNCRNLQNVEIPNTTEEIKDAAFHACSSLSNIVIPNSVQVIGDPYNVNNGYGVFSTCTSLRNIEIPASVTKIGNECFAYSGLESIIIPNSVTKIGDGCFCGTGLESIVLPNSIMEIGKYAFNYCMNLHKVVISENVTDLYATFDFCYKLKEIIYLSAHPIIAEKNIFPDEVYFNATLYLREDAIAEAKTTLPWSLFKQVKAYELSGINEVITDLNSDLPTEIFTLEGFKVETSLETLSKGVYVFRHGSKSWKVAIN